MIIIDSHLDSAWNAWIWNCNLTRSVHEIRKTETGMNERTRAAAAPGSLWRNWHRAHRRFSRDAASSSRSKRQRRICEFRDSQCADLEARSDLPGPTRKAEIRVDFGGNVTGTCSAGRLFLALILLAMLTPACRQKQSHEQPASVEKVGVTVRWDKVVYVSRTTPTLQVVVNPPLRRGTPIHDRVFQALKDLGCDYVRYVPWWPYPKLAVAELEPPEGGRTSWDFSLIDPMTEDFMNAQQGHSVVLTFSTIPQWMFRSEKPVPYPADPNQVTWEYEQGKEFRDPSLKEVTDYYTRLASWYTKGGFTDEYGKRHESGHHYKIDYWEVLNEPNVEYSMTPQTYTRFYDAIVSAIRRVDPKIKFVGLSVGGTSTEHFEHFEYFLNHKNHKSGIPIDMISYHFYAVPTPDQTIEAMQFTFWEQANHFLELVAHIQRIRARLSPETQTTTNELGTISADDPNQNKPGYVLKPIPNAYWNLSGALFAYLYSELAKRGIEAPGVSQLVGYPTQFPSVSMVDWKTGEPNARYWVLKLLRDNLAPGDKLVDTDSPSSCVYAQGFAAPDGRRKLLLVNKRNQPFELSLAGVEGAEVQFVDQTTNFQPPASAKLAGNRITLGGFSVAVVTLTK